MALAEVPDPTQPAHVHAAATKVWVREHLGELTDELAATTPVGDPAALADHRTLLLDGAYASTQAELDEAGFPDGGTTPSVIFDSALFTRRPWGSSSAPTCSAGAGEH